MIWISVKVQSHLFIQEAVKQEDEEPLKWKKHILYIINSSFKHL